YFADMPFSYIGPTDRYLVICDMLHDILNDGAATNHRAIVRLEDLDAYTTTASMKQLTDYLYGLKIPFTMATIPLYTDPNGYYNGGVPETIHLAQATGLQSALNYAIARGGSIVMHGYTHQYDSTPNVQNAVSGNDYEFWYAVQNRPVDEDSEQWAEGRMQDGLQEFTSNGYKVAGWGAPQYQMSPLASQAAAAEFATSYERAVYYTATDPQIGTGAANQDFSAGQFFPYIINQDYYGARIVPENMGSIQYNICNIDPFSCTAYTVQQMLTNAQYALVVRDGFASFFFHPYWLEPGVGVPAMSDFESLVSGITQLGYTWVDATTAK
ncbi:polysaccharide deacetylase family protein, partial [Trinickia dinghuensis]